MGRPRSLTPEKEQDVIAWILLHPRISVDAIRDAISAGGNGPTVSRQYVTRLMQRHNVFSGWMKETV